MENKVIKEELPDKDMTPISASYPEQQRRSKNNAKDRCRSPSSPGPGAAAERSPDGSPASGCAPHRSPHHNGSAGSSSPGAGVVSSGPAGELGTGGRPPPARLKRFLSTLIQFAVDISVDVGDRVRSLVHSLVSSTISVEEFQQALQEATNFPLRPFVLPFLRASLPPLQREIQTLARNAKQAPLQYVRTHEVVALEPGSSEPADIFLGAPTSPTPTKRALDPFYDGPLPQTNGSHHPMDGVDYQPPPKRPHPSGLLVNPSPLLFPLQTHSHLFEYPHPYHIGFHGGVQSDGISSNFDLRRESSARDGLSSNLTSIDQRAPTSNMASSLNLNAVSNNKNDEEWKNINTMLNCILSMVEKTKRALAILQQRGSLFSR
ncbi:protein CBFA2T1-like [Arctopsyche grandis]|uniref:protein CBFA2T1-like n=1 Tax=Arctopsyche grandis TaxID=121162 RepID=UPI00406D760F